MPDLRLWTTGTPKQLAKELRPGGWVLGESRYFPMWLNLHKTKILAQLAKMNPDRKLLWKIRGTESGRYAPDRRRVVIWLGRE